MKQLEKFARGGKILMETKDYKYVVTNNLVFALAKENSGCESCVFGNLEFFKKQNLAAPFAEVENKKINQI